jgi:aryl sulfotransferase
MWQVITDINRADPKFGDGPPEVPEDAGEYFHLWLEDGGAFGDAGTGYWEMERSYWAARHEPNMLLVHYNDLKADRGGEIARIARFLDVELPPATMTAIAEAAGFEQMKAAGETLVPDAAGIWVGGSQTFLNKGVNGRWKEVCDAADLAAYERRVAQEFTPALATWLERGRLGSGEPTSAPD